MQIKNKRLLVLNLVIASLFLSIALMIDIFRVTLPAAGVPGVRISFSGPFLKFIALTMGPWYGGIVHVLKDVLGFFIKNEGYPFNPALTVVEFLKGFSIGLIWILLKKFNLSAFNKLYLAFFAFVGIVAGGSMLGIKYFYSLTVDYYKPEDWEFVVKLNKQSNSTIPALLVISMLAVLAHVIVKRYIKNNDMFNRYLKLVVTVGIPCLLFTTVNTYILLNFFGAPNRAFTTLWIPRIIKEFIAVIYNVYMLFVMLKIYDRLYVKGSGGIDSGEKVSKALV